MHRVRFGRYRPAPRKASVTFRFDEPTLVKLVEVVQAADGVTQIQGYVGNRLNRMRSIGRVSTTEPLADGSVTDFSFADNERAGRFFRLVIRHTSAKHDYGLYRVFLGDGLGNTYSGQPVPPIPEPATLAALTGGAGILLLRRRGR